MMWYDMKIACNTPAFAVAFVLALAASAVPTRAQNNALRDGGFESAPFASWTFSHGGQGGGGSGANVGAPTVGAHEGKISAWLETEPATQSGAVAWASVSQQISIESPANLRIAAWICGEYVSPTTNATVQLRVEYFEDALCAVPLSNHIRMTCDLALAGLPAGKWTVLDLSDRAPEGAHTARISIVLQAHGPAVGRQRVWVDDVSLVLTPEPSLRKR